MAFAERLCALRDEKKANNSKVAGDIGVSDSLFGSWCRNEKKPSFENILRLADYFGVSVDYLLGRSNERQSVSGLSEQEVSLLGLFRDLPSDALRDMVYQQVRTAVDALSATSSCAAPERGEKKDESHASSHGKAI